MNSVHPEKNGYTQNGYNLKMEDVSAEDTKPKVDEGEEGEGEGKTAKEVQLEQVPRMGQSRDGFWISQ